MTKMNWEALSFQVPVITEVPNRSTFSPLGQRCTDFSGNLVTEKNAFMELASDIGAKEPLTIVFEEVLRSGPPYPPPRSPSLVSAAYDRAE